MGTLLPAFAQVVIATVPVGISPSIIAVNSVTNEVYVVNSCGNDPTCTRASSATITVIDGVTLATQTVDIGLAPYGLAVDSVANKVYALNICGSDPSCSSGATITAIDGATLETRTVALGHNAAFLGVNRVTDKIYVSGCQDSPCGTSALVTEIDGVTLSTQNIPTGDVEGAVAVNTVTNKIYVSGGTNPGELVVIDGVTLSTQTVDIHPLPADLPEALAVNEITNKIFAIDCGTDPECIVGGVTVVDGATLSIQSVTVGVYPYVVSVDSVSNQIYVGNQCVTDQDCGQGSVTLINGNSLTTQTINTPNEPDPSPEGVAVNPATQTAYVSACDDNFCLGGTVTAISGQTLSTTTIAAGSYPGALAVNSLTNRIYVAKGNEVSVIGGDTKLQLAAITPCRLVDTRAGDGGIIQGGTVRTFDLPQLAQSKDCGDVSTAAAYSVNATLVPQNGQPVGYLTLWPAGEPQPLASTMNSLDGRIKANAAILPAGVSGKVSVYVTNTADVVLDIDGYFAPSNQSTLAFHSVTPCRVVDTRRSDFPPGLGVPHLSGGVARDFPILNSSCIPSGVTPAAYSFNFTAVPYPDLGNALAYLEVWPTGQQPQHPVSTLNNLTGTYVANAAIVPAGVSEEITAYVSNDTDLLIDVNGYFTAGGNGLSLYPTTLCRVLDTRDNHGQPFSGERTVNVMNSRCALPVTAQAYVFNATVVPSPSLSYLTLWPDTQNQPVVSTLNAADGWITSNMAIVPTSNGSIDAYAAGMTHLILDVSSYFAP